MWKGQDNKNIEGRNSRDSKHFAVWDWRAKEYTSDITG